MASALPPLEFRIESLKLENFRCFQSFETTFAPGWNLIVGENGKGKTSILEALRQPLDLFLAGERSDEEDRRGPPPFGGSDIHRQLHERGGEVRPEPEVKLKFTADIRSASDKVWTISRRTNWTPDGAFSSIVAIKSLSWWVQRQAMIAKGGDPELPVLRWFGVERSGLRRVPGELDVLRPSARMDAYREWWSPDVPIKRVHEWLKTRTLSELQEKEKAPVLEGVQSAIRSCLPGCEDIFYSVKEGEVLIRFSDRVVPFPWLSDGQRVMFATVGDIAWRCVSLNPHWGAEAPAKTSGVVLIDEIDMHLHPKWQRRVVDDLRRTFPKIQFIATSHSPFIIQEMEAGEVINLDSDPPHRTEQAFWKSGIEDIASLVQHVPVVHPSERFRLLEEAATRYFELIQQKEVDPLEVATLRRRLDELEEPFQSDPALLALLRVERRAAGLADAAR